MSASRDINKAKVAYVNLCTEIADLEHRLMSGREPEATRDELEYQLERCIIRRTAMVAALRAVGVVLQGV